MTLYRFIISCFLFLLISPLGYANGEDYKSGYSIPPPVEKVKPPVEKGKKIKKKSKIRSHKKLQRSRKKNKKTRLRQNGPEDLGQGTLTFWLLFAILAILLAIFGAFAIGLGLAPWSVALYVLLGSEITAYLIIMFVLWVDRPGDPAYVQFIFTLLALVIINILIGIAFIIWGLVISWVFGWIIGLILLGLAILFLGLNLILAHIDTKD